MKTKIFLTAILFLIGSFIITSSFAQDPHNYLADTVWLKSGVVIPCKIVSIDSTENAITLKYYNQNGIQVFEPITFDLIRTFVKGQEITPYKTIEEKKIILLPDSLKSVKKYFGLGYGYPEQIVGLSFTVVLKNDWGGSLSYKHTSFDVGSGWFNVTPGDQFDEFSLCAVKEFPSKTMRWIRCGLEAGPSFVMYEKVEKKHFSGNYWKYESSQHTTIGLALRAKLEFPVCRWFGFEIAAYANINMHRSHAGIEFYIYLGKVRD